MRKIIRFWREYQVPESLTSDQEQQEYVLKVILTSSILVLTVASMVILILYLQGFAGLEMVDRIVLAFFSFLACYILVMRGFFTVPRYFIVVILYLFGIRETIAFGLSTVFVLYYAIALVLSYLLIGRRYLILSLIILTPPLADIWLSKGGYNRMGNYLAYIAIMTAITLLLGVISRLKETFEVEGRRAFAMEAVRQAGASVMASLDMQETIKKILEELKSILPYDSASVLLMQEDNSLKIVGGSGWDNPEDIIGMQFPIPGDNPNSIVIQGGKPHILKNAPEAYAPFRKKPHDHIKSWLGVPLIDNGNIIGMMAIDSKTENHFSEEHIRVVSAFADHVAIAIENALLYELSNQAIKRRSVLYRVSQDMIRASANLEEIFKAIHQAADQLMPCESFVISLLNEKEDIIEGVYLIDRGGRNQNLTIPPGAGLSGEIISTGKSKLVHDVYEETTFEGQHFGHEDEVRSLVAVPLTSAGEIIGMLSAQSYQVGAYNEEDLEILELLAAQAGIAIKNTQLMIEMDYIARTDSLTGLLNRRAFDERLENEIARSERYEYAVSLLMIDVDDFKQYNDLYGHSKGDEHLIKIANLILASVRQPDLVSRIGGEEFSVILPHTVKVGARDLAERIRGTIAQTFNYSSDPAGTVSIGIAEYPQDASDIQTLYNIADQAMFKAKRTGKNRVITAESVEL
ncbi:MAG: sensor domain-containing diguanylate cyclase [Anaerolineales bacterium]|jgi:diguanylate cyclase (GGDEF)-like protein